jgi:hypothetical protein
MKRNASYILFIFKRVFLLFGFCEDLFVCVS